MSGKLIYSSTQEIRRLGISSELPKRDHIGLLVNIDKSGSIYLTIHEPQVCSIEYGEEIGELDSNQLPDKLSAQLKILAKYCRELSRDLSAYAKTIDEETDKLAKKEGRRADLLSSPPLAAYPLSSPLSARLPPHDSSSNKEGEGEREGKGEAGSLSSNLDLYA